MDQVGNTHVEFVATGNKDQDQYARTADFYDLVPSYAEREDGRFYVEMAREARGPVLELGCGTGRVLIPIAQAGVEILGLDSSPSMLAIC